MTLKTFLKRLAIFTLLILVLYLPFQWMLGPVDDAYITCRYSENLAAGEGMVFNPGQKVEGCTAFGMMVLLALFAKLGFPNLVLIAQAFGVLAWALVCTLTLELMRKDPEPPIAFFETLGMVVLVGSLSTLAWVWAGMETPLVAAFWIGAVAAHFREDDRQTLPMLSALLTVGAGLMRPDGILIAVIIALSMLLPLTRNRFVRTVIYSAVVLGLFGGYWLWRWHYFGYPLPNTFYVKVGGGSLRLLAFGALYVGKGMLALGLPLIALLFVHRLGTKFRQVPRRLWVYAGVCLISTAYMIYIGGDFFPMQRFFIPVAAFWALMLVELWRLSPRKSMADDDESAGPATQMQNLVMAIGLLILINIGCALVQTQLFKHIYLVGITEEWSELGRQLDKTLPEDTLIATIPIGALGYWTDRPILDMLGLIDTHIAHREVEYGRGVRGHEKFDTKYVISKNPDLILIWPMHVEPVLSHLLDWNQNNRLSRAQTSMHTFLRNNNRYETYAIPLKQGIFVIASVRRDLVDKEPYASWKKMEGPAKKVLYLEPNEVRALIQRVGKSVIKRDIQRALYRIHRRPSNEQKLF